MAKNNDTDSAPITATPPGAPTIPDVAPITTTDLLQTEAVPEPVEPAPADLIIAPLDLDTAQSDAAIDDIVAQEADEVLAAEDAGLAREQAKAEAQAEPTEHGHPVFWFFIVLLAIIAIMAAVVLTNPNLSL